ncbi:MAG: hypothetical protein AAGI44_13620 [Pseudomonadota bacterium]
MTWTNPLLAIGAVFLLAAFSVFAWLLLFYKSPPVDASWAVQGSPVAASNAVTVRFTGTSTLLFSDGQTQWMVDGWFSRPGPYALLYGEIAPDLQAEAQIHPATKRLLGIFDNQMLVRASDTIHRI